MQLIQVLKRSLLVFAVLAEAALTSACLDPSPSVSLVSSSQCPTTEDYTANANGQVTVDAGPGLIYQAAYMNGVVGASLTLSSVRVLMSSNGLTEAKLEIRRARSGSFSGTLDQVFASAYEVIASSSLTAGLGSSSPDTPLDFAFPTGVSLTVGTEYLFVISSTGGPFTLRTMPSSIISSSASVRDGSGNWTTPTSDIAMRISYSGCQGL